MAKSNAKLPWYSSTPVWGGGGGGGERLKSPLSLGCTFYSWFAALLTDHFLLPLRPLSVTKHGSLFNCSFHSSLYNLHNQYLFPSTFLQMTLQNKLEVKTSALHNKIFRHMTNLTRVDGKIFTGSYSFCMELNCTIFSLHLIHML